MPTIHGKLGVDEELAKILGAIVPKTLSTGAIPGQWQERQSDLEILVSSNQKNGKQCSFLAGAPVSFSETLNIFNHH